MSRHRILENAAAVAGLAAGLIFASSPMASPGQPGEACPASDWLIETAVSNWNVGRHLSVATDPETGESFISFYETTGHDLYLAWTGGPSPGNCGPANAWTCQLLDSGGDVGQYNAIAVGGEGPDAWVWISYYDATNAALKVASVQYNRPTGEIEFHVSTIDSGAPGTGPYKGKHTAIALTPTGFPHIAYQYSNDFSHIDEAQLYARYIASGMGNCGEGDADGFWQCEVIFNDEGVGEYAAIDMVGYDTRTIAFYDRQRGYPFVASYVGSGGNCGLANSWLCRTVEHTTFDTGKYLSLFIEDTGLPHLAYYNETDQSLEHASYVGSGGNCGFSSVSLQWEWQCDWIDDMGSSLTSMGIDIAEDANGHPIIAYQDASSSLGPASLKIARPYEATDWNPVPNCGPIDLMYTWVCETMDEGNSYLDEADTVSLTVKPNGDALVAYRELDSYPYPAEGSVKIAYESTAIFSDGFEAGDVSGWSMAVP